MPFCAAAVSKGLIFHAFILEMRSRIFLPASASVATVLAFLCQRYPHIAATEWQRRMAAGLVQDAAGQALAPEAAYRPNQHVYYSRAVADEAVVPVQEQLLYEDAHIVVADKPHFLPVQPSGRYVRETLLYRLRERLNCPDLSLAHRIDRDTAGVVLLTKQRSQRAAYQNLFRDRLVRKVYWAIAPAPTEAGLHGAASWAQLQAGLSLTSLIADQPGGYMQRQCQPASPQMANAQTQLRLLRLLPAGLALYELQPLTGQRHQLRVQMAALGVPIVGDGIYPMLTPDLAEPHLAAPLQLWARELAFTDPYSGQVRHFVSRLGLAGLETGECA